MRAVHLTINKTFTVSLTSDSSFHFSGTDLMLLQAHVPGVVVSEEEPYESDFVLEHIESQERRVTSSSNKITMYDLWEGSFPDELAHVLYGIVRRLYVSKLQYPVHGACVTVSGKNVLLVGHSGAGKTSVALELLKDSDARIFSGNKTVVMFDQGVLHAVAGTPIITVKEEDCVGLDTDNMQNVHTHWGRCMFTLPTDRYISENMVSIDAVAVVKLTNYTESCVELPESSVAHTLYPYFMDVVHADVVMTAAKAVLSGEVSEESKDSLVQNLSVVNGRGPVYTITGTVQYVANKLREI